MFHQVTIVGYLGGDPVMKYAPEAKPFTGFSVASTRKWKNADGSDGEETIWFRVTVWSGQAESCNQYLHKGSPVLVIGMLVPDRATGGPKVWAKQDGGMGASYEIKAQNVRFLPGGKNGGDYVDVPDDNDGLNVIKPGDPIPFVG
jgi:single-strand DNA-binding protein